MATDLARWMRSVVKSRGSPYTPPPDPQTIRLDDLLHLCGREVDDSKGNLFRKEGEEEPVINYAGDLDLLKLKCVCVIGSRGVSTQGRARAGRIARELGRAGMIVTSGLARGVDEAALRGALSAGGKTVAVIATPLDKAYPAENNELQREMWENHLLISQFPSGQRTFPSDFPKRNRLMAALTDACIIVEASDTSGARHRAAECVRLGRWLFITRSVVENPEVDWPMKLLGPKVAVIDDPEEIISRLRAS